MALKDSDRLLIIGAVIVLPNVCRGMHAAVNYIHILKEEKENAIYMQTEQAHWNAFDTKIAEFDLTSTAIQSTLDSFDSTPTIPTPTVTVTPHP